MTQVSTSYDILFGVRSRVSLDAVLKYDTIQTVSKSLSLPYNTHIVIGIPKSVSLQYAVRATVSKTSSLVYRVRNIIPQGKVLSVVYGVREGVARSKALVFGVRTPVSSSLSKSLLYGVRESLTKSLVLEYDTDVLGDGVAIKEVEIQYHTLVTPTIDEDIITISIPVGSVPPQVVTTSF